MFVAKELCILTLVRVPCRCAVYSPHARVFSCSCISLSLGGVCPALLWKHMNISCRHRRLPPQMGAVCSSSSILIPTTSLLLLLQSLRFAMTTAFLRPLLHRPASLVHPLKGSSNCNPGTTRVLLQRHRASFASTSTGASRPPQPAAMAFDNPLVNVNQV